MAAKELFETSLYSDANIKAYWRFLQDNLTDLIGSVVQSSGSLSTSVSGGKFGYGRNYSGVNANSYTKIPYSLQFSAQNMKTVSFWLKLNAIPASTKFILDNSNTSSGATHFIRLQLSSAGALSWSITGTATFIPQSSANLSAGVWYHVCTTQNGNGSNIIFYIDGVATGSGAAITSAIGSNGIGLYLGRLSFEHGYTGYEPNMVVDDFAVFNRVLTPSEIAMLAKGTPSMFLLF
jgi:hypothetical protein